MAWTEAKIANALSKSFENRALLIVPNTSWPGSECDVLAIAKNLKPIDFEIKISRSDLKADLGKDKWWGSKPWSPRRRVRAWTEAWPRNIWKHYYVLPASIWTPELTEHLPPTSGILKLHEDGRYAGGVQIIVERRAVPNREAKPIEAHDAINIGRLASLRYWQLRVKGES